jgi:hypothetical protein
LAQNEDERENRFAISIALAVFGLIAFGGGGVLLVKDKHVPSYWSGALGVALLLASTFVFLSRPARGDVEIKSDLQMADREMASLHTGKAICRLVPERSRVTVSNTEDVAIDWEPNGCMNGRTQYRQVGETWSRILIPNEDQIASLLEFSPAKREYVASRYLLSLSDMEKARNLRKASEMRSCSTDGESLRNFSNAQEAILSSLPAQPHERLVYRCE